MTPITPSFAAPYCRKHPFRIFLESTPGHCYVLTAYRQYILPILDAPYLWDEQVLGPNKDYRGVFRHPLREMVK